MPREPSRTRAGGGGGAYDPDVTDFSLRRIVTGHREGRPVVVEDGVPPATIGAPTGFGVSEVLWLDGPPTGADAGGDRTGRGFPLEPPAGGMSFRVIRMPAGGDWLRVDGDDPDRPGMHATDTLDLMIVLEGAITLGLEDREVEVRAGDAVVQQGTPHRWRVAGDAPCTYAVAMLRPDESQPEPGLRPSGEAGSGIRRIVTGPPVEVGEAPVLLRAGGTTIVDLWQTGGRVASPRQGGDTGEAWEIEPAGGGVAWRWFEMAPHEPAADEGWHTTATIDVDIVLAGRVALELPGGHRVELAPGDVVVQRATEHRWIPLGEAPLRMAALMLATPT